MIMTDNLYRCATCGEFVYIPYGEIWTYKRVLYKGHPGGIRKWFCSWGCMRKWDAAHPPKVSKMRKGDVQYL